MVETDLGQATISSMTIDDYEVTTEVTDAATGATETSWRLSKWSTYFGYFNNHPELNKAILAYATWAIGRGYSGDARVTALLENINGWGEDTFNSILFNMLVTKKIAGDAYAEIIRNEKGTLVNLKSLDPSVIKIVVDEKGIIKRYEQTTKLPPKRSIRKFQPQEILHLSNDRVADQIHGISVVKACEWVIAARQEAMEDWRRISHRSTIRVMYIDADDTTKLTHVKKEYADAIKKGELMLIPAKRGEAEFGELTLPPIDAFIRWIEYLENFFYQSVGVPKILVSSQGLSEAGAKIGLVTFDPWIIREQTELKADIWNQLALRIEFNKVPSLMDTLGKTEEKTTGPLTFQPKYSFAHLNNFFSS